MENKQLVKQPVRIVGNPSYSKISQGDTKFIPTPYETINLASNDLESGLVSVIAGCPGDGKSTVVHQIALNAIDNGKRVLIVDGEHIQERLVNQLYQKVIGYDQKYYDLVKYNKVWLKEPKVHILPLLERWHDKKLAIFSKNLATELTNLYQLMEFLKAVIQTVKPDLIILDNLMSLISGETDTLNSQQSAFMKFISSLAKNYNAHCCLVAHPNKTVKRGEPFDYYAIAGNSDIANLADLIFIVWREFDPSKGCNGYLSLVKNRPYGKLKKISLAYNSDLNSLFEIVGESVIATKFNWLKEGDQTKWIPEDNSPF